MVASHTFTGCSHTTTPLVSLLFTVNTGSWDTEYGELEVRNIAGTTNGTVISKNLRVTIKSTVFGISCIANTGAGTTIGTLTGANSSFTQATLDINSVVTLENGCGDSTWTGSYQVTSPVGLTVDS